GGAGGSGPLDRRVAVRRAQGVVQDGALRRRLAGRSLSSREHLHVVAVARIQQRCAPVSLPPPHRNPEAEPLGVESQRPLEIAGADGHVMVATPRNDRVLAVHGVSSAKKVVSGEGIPADQSERDANMTSPCFWSSGS